MPSSLDRICDQVFGALSVEIDSIIIAERDRIESERESLMKRRRNLTDKQMRDEIAATVRANLVAKLSKDLP
jgi:hypothetical protein